MVGKTLGLKRSHQDLLLIQTGHFTFTLARETSPPVGDRPSQQASSN